SSKALSNALPSESAHDLHAVMSGVMSVTSQSVSHKSHLRSVLICFPFRLVGEIVVECGFVVRHVAHSWRHEHLPARLKSTIHDALVDGAVPVLRNEELVNIWILGSIDAMRPCGENDYIRVLL